MRITSRTLAPLLVAASLVGCHGESTGPELDPEVVSLAQSFGRVADSLAAAGAEPGVALAYRDVGSMLLRGGRVTPVTISVDGVPAEYLATAQQTLIEPPQCPTGVPCLAVYAPSAITSLIAFQRSDPTRVVQLTAGDPNPASFLPLPTATPPAPSVSITLFEGRGAAYTGRTTVGSLVGTPIAGATCPSRAGAPAPVTTARCTPSTFTATFSGSVAPVPGLFRGNTATGTHTVSMASQQVTGAQFVFNASTCMECRLMGFPVGMLPPLPLMPTEALRATLAASVGSAVTLTFTVTNVGPAPEPLRFNSGQQYDFVVSSGTPGTMGAPVWRWSADKGFTGALTSRTLAPGESVSYSETWTPPGKGTYLAQGLLTSSSHRASAFTVFTVP